MKCRNLSKLSKSLLTSATLISLVALPVSASTQTSATAATQPMVIMLPASANATPMIVPMVVQQPSSVMAPVQPVAALVTNELPAATTITVTPVSEISTKKLAVGDRIELMTSNAVIRGDRVFIPAKAKVIAVVTEAVGRRAFGRGGQMAMRFETLQLADGSMLELTGVHTETGARANGQAADNLGRTGAALAGSFGAVGMLAGLFARAAVTGSSAMIKPGANLVARTGKPLLWNADKNVSIVMTNAPNGTTEPSPAAIALPPKVALN
jgi:hypothetical protein